MKTVKQSKAKAAAAAAASDEPTAADSSKGLESEAPVPAKPNDWGKFKPVTADEQEPPKQEDERRRCRLTRNMGRNPNQRITRSQRNPSTAAEPRQRASQPKRLNLTQAISQKLLQRS